MILLLEKVLQYRLLEAYNAISGDGVIGITIGSSNGLTSATGSNRINAGSITAAEGVSGAGVEVSAG